MSATMLEAQRRWDRHTRYAVTPEFYRRCKSAVWLLTVDGDPALVEGLHITPNFAMAYTRALLIFRKDESGNVYARIP